MARLKHDVLQTIDADRRARGFFRFTDHHLLPNVGLLFANHNHPFDRLWAVADPLVPLSNTLF